MACRGPQIRVWFVIVPTQKKQVLGEGQRVSHWKRGREKKAQDTLVGMEVLPPDIYYPLIHAPDILSSQEMLDYTPNTT
ncbi:hypothetical protein E2C01_035951 [Portunus trituberculatus]|uniref:Uncharacterized protein n=1 Tax=Portunus trituberculatus TaxID=210409 RepID=A0A5B7F5P4_PORTR|nr:hypothetical protein [Portunus trituberculatus]